MIPDSVVVDRLLALYQDTPQGFDHVESTSGVYWGLKRFPDCDLVIARGSATPRDFIRDLESELGRVLPHYTSLGLLPDGFSRGLTDAYTAIRHQLRPDVPSVFSGHSLGAAHAAELAALHRLSNGAVAKIMLCGCPRPGTGLLGLALKGVAISSYRNLSDPVCDVPVPIAHILPWTHVAEFILLKEHPPAHDPWGPFKDHHSELYAAGIKRLG